MQSSTCAAISCTVMFQRAKTWCSAKLHYDFLLFALLNTRSRMKLCVLSTFFLFVFFVCHSLCSIGSCTPFLVFWFSSMTRNCNTAHWRHRTLFAIFDSGALRPHVFVYSIANGSLNISISVSTKLRKYSFNKSLQIKQWPGIWTGFKPMKIVIPGA